MHERWFERTGNYQRRAGGGWNRYGEETRKAQVMNAEAFLEG